MTAPVDLAAVEARAAAATPGPWERGNRWHIQGAEFCPCRPEWGPANEARRDINGTRMLSHAHRLPEARWEHGISTAELQKGGYPWSVVVDTDEYGLMSDADATFIAHARTDVEALVAELRRLRADVARVRELAAEMQNRAVVYRAAATNGGITLGQQWDLQQRARRLDQEATDLFAALGAAPERAT